MGIKSDIYRVMKRYFSLSDLLKVYDACNNVIALDIIYDEKVAIIELILENVMATLD